MSVDRYVDTSSTDDAPPVPSSERPATVHALPRSAASAPRVLIVAGNLTLLRGHYEGVIGRLVAAGAVVRIRYLKDSTLSVDDYRETLRDVPGPVEVLPAPRRSRQPEDIFALRLRELGNILRYAHPDYRGKLVLADRALEKTGASARYWGLRIRRLGTRRATAVARAVAWVHAALPAPKYALDLLAEEQPDVVAVVPVIRTPVLVDYLAAAAEMGVRTAIWVQSWDNLTNKGLLHFVPDRVFVWNEVQTTELARYHGIGRESVCMTGAQTFDHWYDGREPPDRETFCAELGLDPALPIILYLASSRGIAPDEPAFFEQWLRAVRSSGDPVLRTASVLVRPHPSRAQEWHDGGFDREPGVVLSPATVRDQLNSDGFREQYRAELHHSSLAFGINTSGLIDAAIFGKPALTVELPELYDGQRGTVHFEHLADDQYGLLHLSSSLEDHIRMLGELIGRDVYEHDETSMRFVRTFVRPHGLESAPADVFAREMTALGAAPPRTRSRSLAARGVARLVLLLIAAAARILRLRRLTPNRLGKGLRRRVVRPAKRLLRRAVRLALLILRPVVRRSLSPAVRALGGRRDRQERRPG